MTRDEIFNDFEGRAPVYVPVPAPEWKPGASWFVKQLDAGELAHLQEKAAEMDAAGLGHVWFACVAVHDPESGKRVFNDLDVDNLKKLPGGLFTRLFRIGGRANGYGAEAEKELEKNLQTPSAVSCSTST